MVQVYNFLAAWQLFPEKGIYEQGELPNIGQVYFYMKKMMVAILYL